MVFFCKNPNTPNLLWCLGCGALRASKRDTFLRGIRTKPFNNIRIKKCAKCARIGVNNKHRTPVPKVERICDLCRKPTLMYPSEAKKRLRCGKCSNMKLVSHFRLCVLCGKCKQVKTVAETKYNRCITCANKAKKVVKNLKAKPKKRYKQISTKPDKKTKRRKPKKVKEPEKSQFEQDCEEFLEPSKPNKNTGIENRELSNQEKELIATFLKKNKVTKITPFANDKYSNTKMKI